MELCYPLSALIWIGIGLGFIGFGIGVLLADRQNKTTHKSEKENKEEEE